MGRAISIKDEEGGVVDVVIRDIRKAEKGKLKGKEYILYKGRMYRVYKRDNKYYVKFW